MAIKTDDTVIDKLLINNFTSRWKLKKLLWDWLRDKEGESCYRFFCDCDHPGQWSG